MPDDEYENTDRMREILQGMDPVIPRSDVQIFADEATSEDLQEAVLAVLSQHPELWFIEAKTKDGKSILVHRGPHP